MNPLLRVSPLEAVLAVVIFLSAEAAAAALAIVSGAAVVPCIVAFVAVALAALCLVRKPCDSLPVTAAAIVIGLVAIAAGAMSVALPPSQWGEFSGWHRGASSILLITMAVRGRALAAWIGLSAMTLVTLVAVVTAGSPASLAIVLNARYAATLAIGTVFAFAFARLGGRTRRVREKRGQSGLARERSEAASQDMRLAMSALRERLERILHNAEAGRLSPADRGKARLIGAELRDGLSAPSLRNARVSAVVRRARRRGMLISLAEAPGTGVIPEALLDASASRLADVLRVFEDGSKSVTVRARARTAGWMLVVTSDDRVARIQLDDDQRRTGPDPSPDGVQQPPAYTGGHGRNPPRPPREAG
jgi:hypothetical protein